MFSKDEGYFFLETGWIVLVGPVSMPVRPVSEKRLSAVLELFRKSAKYVFVFLKENTSPSCLSFIAIRLN